MTPVSLAFEQKEKLSWLIVDTVVDVFFFIDICVIFNTAFYDQDFKIVDNRKEIAIEYLKGWFTIDLVAVIPFEILFGTTNLNEFVRITRIGRMYKLIKLTKLLRVMKVIRDRSNIMKYV